MKAACSPLVWPAIGSICQLISAAKPRLHLFDHLGLLREATSVTRRHQNGPAIAVGNYCAARMRPRDHVACREFLMDQIDQLVCSHHLLRHGGFIAALDGRSNSGGRP
jgi:hypothetical protein